MYHLITLNLINLFIVTIAMSQHFVCYAQNENVEMYQYIFPIPGSSNISPENNIIIRHGNIIDQSTIASSRISVVGSESGMHKGELFLSDELMTLIFIPENIFMPGEEIKVQLNEGIKLIDGEVLEQLEFNFFIKSVFPSEENLKIINDLVNSADPDWSDEIITDNSISNSIDKSNAGYPEMIQNISDNPSPGYTFLTLLYQNQHSYLMIMDNDGIPLFYRRLPWGSRNFHPNPDGSLTYYDHSANKFFQMDSSYTIIDSFYCRNGFESTTGFHELILLENGHSILLARDNRVVRMDTIVVGGDSAATVSGFVIQELDANSNVIFQWNTFDHFQITDATEDINLLANFINPFHCNSLALDNDGNLLLSSRHLDEVTKIDRQTGDIIWRFGGAECANNQFMFINDLRTFSHQHYVRRLLNGNLTLLDNGNLLSPQYSRGLEYELDEINKTAALVWSFGNNPLTFTGAAGSVQRLSNNNTIIGWGIPEGVSPGITESDISGNVTLDFSYPDIYTSYRALKYPWKTNLFVTNPDSIFFESVDPGDSASILVSLKSNSSEEIIITGFHNRDLQYSINHSIPFTLLPFQTEMIEVMFKPVAEGFFTDTLHIRSETDTSRIAQILVIAGRTDTTYSIVPNEIIAADFKLAQNFPNPFNPFTTIKFSIPEQCNVVLKIYDVLGKEVATLVNEEKPAGEYEVEFNASGLTSGIYFYKLQAGDYNRTRKMILLR